MAFTIVSRFACLLTLLALAATPALTQLRVGDDQLLRQGGGLPDEAENNDAFGSDIVAGDFNGDGWDDLAISSPGENDRKGIVHVAYGDPSGLITGGAQRWRQGADGIEGNDEDNDVFGSSLATGDFNGDGFDDLAIGVPGEDGGRGVVHVIYGSAAGLAATGNQVWSQNELEGGGRDAGDLFGSDVAAGDFNGDGFDDLAVGSPGESNSGGLAHVIFGSANRLTANGNKRIRQSADGITGSREAGDSFGLSLAAGDFNGDGFDDLAVSVPGEDNGKGRVHTIPGFSGGLDTQRTRDWEQGSDGVPGNDEDGDFFGIVMATGDFNGDGYDELVISATGESSNRGDVVVLPGTNNGLTGTGSQQWRQGLNGLSDREEAGDRFGSALAAGDFNRDGFADLAIGVRGEDGNIGLVHVLHGGPALLSAQGAQVFAQGFDGLQDRAESNDNFGWALAAGNFGKDGATDLAVSAPGEDNARGVVHVIFGTATRFPVISAVVGAGLSTPAVVSLSPNGIITVFGLNFAPDGFFRTVTNADLVNGRVPTNLANVCLEIGGRRAPIFGVFGGAPNQINAQSNLLPGQVIAQNGPVNLRVIVRCGQAGELASDPVAANAAEAAPEFFVFVFGQNANGVNPIAAVNETTRALVGQPGLIPGVFFEEAKAGDVVTVYMTGLGETAPRFEAGELPGGAAQTVVPVRVTVGGVVVQTIYAGVSPEFAGLYQVSFPVPAGVVGNAAVVVTLLNPVGAISTPPGGFIRIAPPM